MSKTKYIAYDSSGKILHQYEEDTENLIKNSSTKERVLNSWKKDRKVTRIKVDGKLVWNR